MFQVYAGSNSKADKIKSFEKRNDAIVKCLFLRNNNDGHFGVFNSERNRVTYHTDRKNPEFLEACK